VEPKNSILPEGVVTDVEPALLGVDAAAKYVGLGRTEMFLLLRRGRVKSIKHGRRRLVPRSELDKFIQRALAEQQSPEQEQQQ
jgi:excisionase family DNA binding protein